MNKELVLRVPREEIKQWELREGAQDFQKRFVLMDGEQ